MYLYNVIKQPELENNGLHFLPLRYIAGLDRADLAVEAAIDAADEMPLPEAEEQEDLTTVLLIQAEEAHQEALTAKAEAEKILAEARREAGQIKQEARKLAEQEGEHLKQVAQKTAFEQGYQDGQREGRSKAEEAAKEIRETAVDVLCQAEENRRRILESMEESIINLSREIAEKLLTAQITLEPEVVCSVARESLRMLAGRLQVVIYINPAELELYERKKEELIAILPKRAEMQIIADPTIQPGGCRIDTENGQVDATIEARRKALMNALYGEEE